MGETSTVEGAQKIGGIFSAIKAQGDDKDVIAFFHGHMHNNANCRRTSSIFICLNGGSSFAGYGKLGMERRTRIISISKFGEQVDTWHRMEKTPGAVEFITCTKSRYNLIDTFDQAERSSKYNNLAQ